MNLLEIGKILRPHGIKGAVKVECFVDEHFSMFKDVNSLFNCFLKSNNFIIKFS